jgi:hypothetical protein
MFLAAGLVLGCAALWPLNGGSAGAAAPAAAPKDKAVGGGTNTVTATNTTLPIPDSVFNLTATPTKNPFFPQSLRQPVPQATAAPGVSASSFVLNALSGSSDSRLAMINHKTMGVGETQELTLPTGARVNIRLLQIKEGSVVIRVITPPQADLIEVTLSDGKKGEKVYIGANDSAHDK